MTTDLQALIQHLRGGDWNLRAPQEMADMIADKLEAALAAAPSTSPAAAPTFDDALKIAKGCFDYKGGYDDAHLEIFHHGIGTVVAALTSVAKRGFDSQSTTLHRMGSEGAPVMVNGLTEAETAATASVAGLSPAAAAVALDPERAWGSCQAAAIKTLMGQGYTWAGGELWKPPLGPSTSAAEQAGRWVPSGWALETGTGGFGEKGDRWVCVRHLESQCGQDFYEDRDPLIFNFLNAIAAAPSASPAEAPAKAMTADRAVYFLHRFKHDEKMLGPNEQAALDFAIAALSAAHPQPVVPAGQAASDWRDEVQRNESYWREEAEEFKKYLADCDRCAIVPDAAGAFAAAWQAAKPQPVAWQAAAGVQGEKPNRNDPVSALAIRAIVAKGYCTQEQANECFSLACDALEAEAARMNEELPWVTRVPAPAVERGVAEEQTAAARDVLAERQRQISAEGWTPEHDDEHAGAEMARAAACYALNAAGVRMSRLPEDLWPWSTDWWKPDAPRRSLVKAGALILAEIERLDRATLSTAGKEQA